MINITKLYCGGSFSGDELRYPSSGRKAPVVVWNCTVRCNLRCRHCYSDAGGHGDRGEIGTAEARRMISDLAGCGVPVLLISGGEPLLRPDVYELGSFARKAGMSVILSTNGTLISGVEARSLRESGFGYVGISLDGLGETHDLLRGSPGSFENAARGFGACVREGIRTGVRFTVTRHNREAVGDVMDFARDMGAARICIYHLVYCGRGSDMVGDDLTHGEARLLMETILRKTDEYHRSGADIEVLTVDNSADGVYVYLKLVREGRGRAEIALELLKVSGGNSSGIGIACVDSRGDVFPDQFMRATSLGNLREKPFSRIWSDGGNAVLSGLRNRGGVLKGRCRGCRWRRECNGNMRARALAVYGDLWEEDPACYLTQDEIL